MASTFRQYIDAGKSIAKVRASSLLFEMSKLVLHRLVTGYGPEHYMMYFLFNKPVSISSWRKYLDKRDFCRLLFRYNKKEQFRALEDKVEFGSACSRHGLAHPEIAFTCDYDGESTLFTNINTPNIAAGFTNLALGKYIVKASNGSYGLNIWSIEKTADGIQVHNNEQRLTTEEFAALLTNSKLSYLVQEKIEVTRNLRNIMPGLACGGMRIYTFLRSDGTVSAPYCLVKLTVVGSITDNFSNGKSGNLTAIANLENLTIQRVLTRTADGLYTEVTHHPDTCVDLRDYPVPELEQALELSSRCALAFPNVPAVGWDIVVTDQGAFVLEGNAMFDPYGFQWCAGFGARDLIPELLSNAFASAHDFQKV